MTNVPQTTPIRWSTKQLSESCSRSPQSFRPGKTLRLGVISNPLSGGNRRGMRTIVESLAHYPQAHHVEATTPAEVESALTELGRRNAEVVAVNGGDGTIHAVLTGLFRDPASGPPPILALLRSGTASMIARDVGLGGSRRAALRRLLTWISSGSGSAGIVERPLLKVERSFGKEPLYGMFFGAAGICQGIRFCLNRVHTKGVSGQLAAGLTLGRLLLAALRRDRSLLFPVPAAVALDEGRSEQGEFLLILMSTLERLFFGIRPYWCTETGPIYYTALGAHPDHLVRALPSLLRGQKSRFSTPEHGYFSRKIREAHLTLTGSFALDGELYPTETGGEGIHVTEGGKASFLKV